MKKRDKEIVAEFILEVEGYCQLIESSQTIANGEFVYLCLLSLTMLLNKGIQLPDVKDLGRRVFDSKVSFAMIELMKKFKDKDSYGHVHFPYGDNRVWETEKRPEERTWRNYPFDKEVVCVTRVGDDLRGIYDEMKSGLILYEKGRTKNKQNAIWIWREALHDRSGRKLVSVLTALLFLHSDYNVDEQWKNSV